MRLPRDKQEGEKLGERIRAKREQKELTQEQLASQLGVKLYPCDQGSSKCTSGGGQLFSLPLTVRCIERLEKGKCHDVDQGLLSDLLMTLDLVPARRRADALARLTESEIQGTIRALSSGPRPQAYLPILEGGIVLSPSAIQIGGSCPMGFARSCSGCRVQWDCPGPN